MRKLLSILLTFSVVVSIGVSASAATVNSKTVEKGEDIAFLNDKERQLEWEKQAWENVDNKPIVGDWKSNSRATGTWSWRDGVICYVDSYASVPFFNNGHAGIVGIAPHYYCVVESNPGEGVKLKEGAWNSKFSGRIVQVGVTSTTTQQDHNAAAWACNQVGKTYALGGLSDRNSFYCSQLVYAAYKDTCNVDLDTASWPGFIHPIELVNNAKTTIIFDTK